ncbi:alpha-N-acetylglucosaminidase TIM-barrel domain-containing protein [Promicromonospora iranensis]|uniref:Alpha-N-acetylglucosaminidase n=1 Tax=Promicromonospora iranensis TaxID=1105144 RepID=A0ABU2CGT7_9MICO|nr:alpha-N-acetylglucosaminidase TIM-barrel domain-containing protein [Promicromonospora iranensis]MDR7380555.1 alpha-N-acetylglucosaminidase [Promicromonospora iranensis]
MSAWADAVRGVAERVGLDPRQITVEPLPLVAPHAAQPVAPHDTADYRAEAGRLTIRATGPVAASVALARYVREAFGTRLSWQRPRVTGSPSPLPDAPRATVSSPHEVRYYLNVVTFGYSTPFWGWDRWEREIDWMALHGITHPLMLVAHEAVLAETFRRAGLPAAEAAEWLGGAAHFPWTFMGGMHSFGGPLPARWAERRVDLARRVLARMRELGMTPVLPAFGGHVPPALAGPGPDDAHPAPEHAAGEIEWQGWHVPLLHPESPRHQELFATFAQVQRELIGPGSGYYAVDPYIESVPPSGDVGYLRAAGRGTYRALAGADPDAVWVLQGWPFHYKGTFWTPDRVAAYLHDVPADRTLVLDLWGEHAPLHTALLADRAPLAGRPWVWCALHDFGGRPALFGDLRGLVRDVRALPDGVPHLRGTGLAPEAIENNEVFYELATDLAWDDAPRSPAELDGWLERFVLDRYDLSDRGSAPGGVSGPDGERRADLARLALHAWHTIYSTLYADGRTRSVPTPVIARPWTAGLPFPAQRSAGEAITGGTTAGSGAAEDSGPPTPSSDVDAENDPAAAAALPRLAEAVRELTEVHDNLPGATPGPVPDPAREVLGADIAELTGHVLAQGTRVHVRGILAAARAGDPDGVRAHRDRLRADLLELDDLAGARPETRVTTWIDAARAWGDTAAERDAMEREARSLVSVWGGQHNGLHDYSGRHWQGLVRDLYLPRWQAWADWLADAAARGPVPPDADPTALRAHIVALEERWRGARRPDPG